MAKKDAVRRDAGATKPKQLRKRLRKAEAKLIEAEAERDHAQAQVEAFVIIADEIRAQLAESERSTTEATAKRASRKHAATPEAPASATVGQAQKGT